MTASSLRWWQYIGPWRLRPWVIFWGIGAVTLISTSSARRLALLESPGVAILDVFLPAFIGTSAFSLVILVLRSVFPSGAPRHLVSYLLVVLLGAAMGSVTAHITARVIGVGTADEVVFIPLQALRAWVWAVFLLAIAGVTVRRLSRQTQIAEEALAVSLQQQELMLVNEERSRRQISAFLHDRVQAGLMTACLELRVAAKDTGSISGSELDRIIARIDDIRGLEVRQAARDLSPDLVHVDLRTALSELARQYEPGLTTSIDIRGVDRAGVLTTEHLLACFRICEQALLNSAVHGEARHMDVSIDLDSDGWVRVRLQDDGSFNGQQQVRPGFGFAIIDGWCRVLGGRWSLASGPDAGGLLTADFPVESGTRENLDAGPMSQM